MESKQKELERRWAKAWAGTGTLGWFATVHPGTQQGWWQSEDCSCGSRDTEGEEEVTKGNQDSCSSSSTDRTWRMLWLKDSAVMIGQLRYARLPRRYTD
jgi:hypothetical protein